MAELISIGVTKKTYADRGIKGGVSIQTMIRRAFEAVLPNAVRDVKQKYLSGPTTPYSISKRKGDIFRGTYHSIYETAKTVVGKLVIGEWAKHAPLHIGMSGEKTSLMTSGRFTIPFPHVRNADGSWRAPYSPGNLRSVPGLFRRGDILFQRSAGNTITPVFVLKTRIEMPQRVDLPSIERDIRPALIRTMKLEFDGYDYGYLRMMRSE